MKRTSTGKEFIIFSADITARNASCATEEFYGFRDNRLSTCAMQGFREYKNSILQNKDFRKQM